MDPMPGKHPTNGAPVPAPLVVFAPEVSKLARITPSLQQKQPPTECSKKVMGPSVKPEVLCVYADAG